MPHISKRKLDKKTLGKIFSKLITLIGHAKNHRDLARILDELLTETEKIMLLKRLGILYLLQENLNQDEIAEILKTTRQTVARIELQLLKIPDNDGSTYWCIDNGGSADGSTTLLTVSDVACP